VSENESVVVVGGGYLGMSTAYYLARSGVSVTLVEREHPGWGASSRNAGYLSVITRSAGPQLELAMAGRALYDELAQELDDFGFRASGTLTYYFEEQAGFPASFAERRRDDGLDVNVISGDEARELCPLLPDDVVGGVYCTNDGFIHPGMLADAFAKAIEREGVKIEIADVLALDISGGQCNGVRTSNGGLSADAVVVAAGAWSSTLLKQHDIPLELIRMRSQLAETVPTEENFDVALFGPSFFHEYEFVRELPGYDDDLVLHPLQRVMPQVGTLELFARRPDGRIVLGCPMELVGDHDRPTLAGMALTFGILGDHVPALQDIPLERMWAGVLPQLGDGLPVFDAVSAVDNLYVGTGHAYGAMTGPVSGKLLADQILGNQVELDVSPFRYDRAAVTEGLARELTL
jgi:glycine/D-amino acid oxidase-like deaminating enzyme